MPSSDGAGAVSGEDLTLFQGNTVPPTGGFGVDPKLMIRMKQLKQLKAEEKRFKGELNQKDALRFLLSSHGYVFKEIFEPSQYRHELIGELRRELQERGVP